MASIRERKFKHTTIYQVQIRRSGIPQYTISFMSYDEAHMWVKENEFKYIKNPSLYPKNDQKSLFWLNRKRKKEEQGLFSYERRNP